MHPLLHDTYYQDRWTERALIYDFPADEALIRGLHAMQSHFYNRNIPIEIPVVRIMNTAHWLAAYMFNTTCSGDQNEYDALTYNSVGRDKQLMFISLIVLVAMLKRTEGFRARQCRNVLTEDRSEDFYEGISLYEQFLESHDEHFAEEDFMVDIMAQVKERDEIIAEQTKQIITLQKQLNMKNESLSNKHIGYNVENMTINMSGGTLVQHADLVQASGDIQLTATEQIKKAVRPQEGDYQSLAEWLENEKKKGIDYYAEAGYNRSKMCRELRKILGWEPDQNSLRKAQNK